jgi:hypothetical protein
MYFSSPAALMTESRSNDSLVSSASSGNNVSSSAAKSSTRKGLASIRLGASRSV